MPVTTANCLITHVNISDTNIEEIREFTFVRCTRLHDVRLPYTVHTIHVKAFMDCAALQELAIPPSLHYIASRAFLDCTALCPAWRWPQWLHMIQDLGCVSDLG